MKRRVVPASAAGLETRLSHPRRSWQRLCVLCAAWLTSCSRSEPPERAHDPSGFEVLELRYLGMNGHVQPAELAEDLGYLAPLRLSFVGSTISGPQNLESVVAGGTEFGWAFNGVIVNFVAKKAPIRAVVGYYGIDDLRHSAFFVLNDSPIRNADALLGKQVAINLLGAHSEFIAKEYLFRDGLSREDVRRVALVALPPADAESALRRKQVDVAALYDTYRERALERGGIRLLFSDYDLFGAITAGSYVMRRDFIGDNLNTARHFVSAVARALRWSRETPREEVVERLERIVERRDRNEDPSDVKQWGSYGVAANGGVMSEREFQIWIDWLVKDGGMGRGQISAADLFDNDLNPFASSTAASPR